VARASTRGHTTVDTNAMHWRVHQSYTKKSESHHLLAICSSSDAMHAESYGGDVDLHHHVSATSSNTDARAARQA
jgi:hypothetical protein